MSTRRLSHSQWSRINTFLLDLYADRSREHFYRCCVEGLPALLDVTWASWQRMDEDYRFIDYRVTDSYADVVPTYTDAMEATMDSQPFIVGPQTAPVEGVYVDEDFVSEREKHDLAIFREAYRHVDIKYQMYTELQFAPGWRSLLLANSTRPITDDQRGIMEAVSPHLIASFRSLLLAEDPVPAYPDSDRRSGLLQQLTPRQQQVTGLLLRGLPRKIVAEEMNLSLHTINEYVRDVYSRLDIRSHAELLALLSSGYGR